MDKLCGCGKPIKGKGTRCSACVKRDQRAKGAPEESPAPEVVKHVHETLMVNDEEVRVWDPDGLPNFRRLGLCEHHMQYNYCGKTDCAYAGDRAIL